MDKVEEFARNATVIKDGFEPKSGNFRYGYESRHYARGFGYNTKLNSAILNGILNRITVNLQRLLHCNIGDLGLEYPGLGRWCKLSDIKSGVHTDREGYLKAAWWGNYYAWLSKFFLRKDKLSDWWTGGEATERGYLPASEGKKVADLLFGTNLPPLIIRAGDAIFTQHSNSSRLVATEVKDSGILMFEASGLARTDGIRYTLVKIFHREKLMDVEVRRSYFLRAEVIPVVEFDINMRWGGVTITGGKRYVCPHGIRCILKGDTILMLEGKIEGVTSGTVRPSNDQFMGALFA